MQNGRPDKPLVVKCTFNDRIKRITFSSARNCTYDLLKARVEQCFSLYATPYAIAYKDDDGEITTVATDYDLTEAVHYFHAGNDDPPVSSAASILSGRSFGSRKITLRVDITVDYDGPSLSDTSSLVSMEEYRNRNGSEFSLSFNVTPSVELDDDSVTVSSRDTGSGPSNEVIRSRQAIREHSYSNQRPPQLPPTPVWDEQSAASWAESLNASDNIQQSSPTIGAETQRGRVPSSDARVQEPVTPDLPENPAAVFERLKLEEAALDDDSQLNHGPSISDTDRGIAWLRDQNARTIKSMLGALPEPSESDAASIAQERDDSPEVLGGDLALQRDQRGKYYYSYTSAGSSSASQSHDSGYYDGPSASSDIDAGMEDFQSKPPEKNRPTSMQLNWLATQQLSSIPHHPHRSQSEPYASRSITESYDSDSIYQGNYSMFDSDIPLEVLQFVPLTGPPSHILTDCSECGVILDSIRYVCSTCGEKKPVEWLANNTGKGKGKSLASEIHCISHNPSHSNLSSSASQSTSSEMYYQNFHKPLPSLPSPPNSSTSTLSQGIGYELCSGCIESAGVTHALEVNLAPGSSPGGRGTSSPSSPEDAQRALSQWRRTAPAKGKLRHGYLEKVWGHKGWEDVEQDDLHNSRCSTCNTALINKRYKCASCQKFNLCRACYSQVHEIHPSHAFLVVLDKPLRSHSEPEFHLTSMMDQSDEQSMTHCGIKCAHCMLDIVGARFHCAVCESIDICSNCESAGLPGNLDSSDGGHNSSHIMIKIPRPLDTTEVQTASRRAINLWTGRDAATVQRRSRPSSIISSYARTVVGSGTDDSPFLADHHMFCSACNQPIVGVRYQCASCPSVPKSYSLCSSCEPRSYILHDPMHTFFKLPRPVKRPIESSFPMLPRLYKIPAGPPPGLINPTAPREYLRSLLHTTALCDRCMERIRGEWFRCAYCSKDLCDACEALDTHDDTHLFLVFKSIVDMPLFRHIANVDNPNECPPLIPYPVYR